MRVGLDEFHIYQHSELQPTIILCVSLPVSDTVVQCNRSSSTQATKSSQIHKNLPGRPPNPVFLKELGFGSNEDADLTSDGRWKIQTIKKILRRWAPGSGDIPSVSHFLGLQQGMVYNYRFKNCHERI
ncbi:predicted protein [Histoplasma capsulatum var. duboisii H88]|uniref:Predicted protein n=1 Tax=Ajellomyces capsulatus (strain H88) TaxID=544711 RepID=F0U8H8_AJEC8|nr:predicted protein [Histoplasma capsulatum var. duboisii H88]